MTEQQQEGDNMPPKDSPTGFLDTVPEALSKHISKLFTKLFGVMQEILWIPKS